MATYDPNVANRFADALDTILPGRTRSQKSDIQQLAKAVAAKVSVFVTRDKNILKNSSTIFTLTGLQVMRPTELIIRLHELADGQSYRPRRIAGLGLEWRRSTSSDVATFPLAVFRTENEKESSLRDTLAFFLSDPSSFILEILWFSGRAVAIRILEHRPGGILAVPFFRTARGVEKSLFNRYLVADTMARAVQEDQDMVRFEANSVPVNVVLDLLEMGFMEDSGHFTRYCFSRCVNRKEALSKIAALSPACGDRLQAASGIRLEEHCSPCSVRGTNQNYFLVPIRSSYAMSLFDVSQSANDFFGGQTNVLLRWENVYYRTKTRHKMLKAPARILWYVSQKERRVVAVSRLTEVVIDTPKVLFKRFKAFGILDWHDLCEMCGGDPSREIMALVFSHTFSFRSPVSLEALRVILKEDGIGVALQSPQRIPASTFEKVFRRGFRS